MRQPAVETAQSLAQLAPGNLQLLHLVLQGGALNSEDGRGPVSATHDSVRIVKYAGNVLPFDVPKRVRACKGNKRRGMQLLQVNPQLRPRRQNYSALNQVLELSNVAWPLPAFQNTHGPGRDGKGRAVHAPGKLSHEKVC